MRIDTLDELEYFRNGGILHYVLRNLAKAAWKGRVGRAPLGAKPTFPTLS